MALAGAERVFDLLDEPVEEDHGYVTLVNAKRENGELVECKERTGLWAWKHPHSDGTTTYTELKGDIVLDDVSRTVRVGGVPVELTFKEYALLHLFLEHPEEVLARERIMKDVWDTDDLLESRTIDMHVRTLRQKLGAAGEAIRTVRKVGYKLSTEGSDD